MTQNQKLLIIGKTEPIGGVTVHVNRLIQSLEKIKFPHRFIRLSVKNMPSIFWNIFQADIVHIHSSRVLLMYILALYSRIFNTKSILTYHAEVGIHGGFTKIWEKFALRWVDIPIMLNTKSLNFALKLNANARQISSFIPPVGIEELPKNITEKINAFEDNSTYIFCTNAFKRYTMPDGRDVYGIGKLLEIFSTLPEHTLIVSDPSGQNLQFHLKTWKTIPSNIYFIDHPHSFYAILKRSHCMIRATLTDGDSISIKEALNLNKNVICSDVVSRPSSCITFKTDNDLDLKNRITSFQYSPSSISEKLNGFEDLLKLYSDKS